MNMFADDAKIQRKITTENSSLELQNELTKLHELSQKWRMEINAEKCHAIKFGKSGMRPHREYKFGNDRLQEFEKRKSADK